jgi:pyridoxal phosphate enzyme (YggS family)
MIAENLEAVRRRIEAACRRAGRAVEEVGLVCVTKEASPAQIEEASRAGVRVFGENRVQDAVPKAALFAGRAEWHLVGHLQTNKAPDAVRIFSLIHSLDSLRLAEAIDKAASKAGKVQDVLVQVNTSAEETKFGIKPEEAEEFFKGLSLYRNISIKGLMTIAPEVKDAELARPCFRALRELRNRLNDIRYTIYDIRS